VTYPVDLTEYLIVPQKREKPQKKRKRKSKNGNTEDEDDGNDEEGEFEITPAIAQTRNLAKMLSKRKW
jgi:hypothetical protein